MINFKCPVCGNPLEDYAAYFKCSNGHSFDKSKFGYVNLLMSGQSSSKRHGDDRIMIRARRDFLDKGYYSFLRDKVEYVLEQNIPKRSKILDAGCGECYYSLGISEKNPEFDLSGIDISKDALEYASKRGAHFPLAVASAFSLPYENGVFDAILNIFSPMSEKEFKRVLKPSGILISVVPLEEHLFSLKECIYDNPYMNEAPFKELDGFILSDYIEIRNDIKLTSNEDIQNLFKMTPYYYKTGKNDQEKINNINELETIAAFGILIFKKDGEQ